MQVTLNPVTVGPKVGPQTAKLTATSRLSRLLRSSPVITAPHLCAPPCPLPVSPPSLSPVLFSPPSCVPPAQHGGPFEPKGGRTLRR